MRKLTSYLLILIIVANAGVSLGQTGNLTGIIKDSAGNAIPYTIVTIQNINLAAQSNEKGNYLIKNIPVGKYTVSISRSSYQPLSKTVTIKENETAQLDFNLIETANLLNEVVINGVHNITGMGHLAEVHDGIVYSGKKNEVLILDSLNANTAQDNPRQVLGRIPGSNYSETEGSGFPSNGIGFRGLNPTQSIETNTREDGYNIAGDIYGYPESYFIPPLEAIDRIEITRGAASLQFGPQFGGVINYIVKDGPSDKPFQFSTAVTGGSYGLLNSFSSIGGTYKKWSYYSFIEYNYDAGWRPNSQTEQASGFARLEYRANKKFKIGIEYSLLRNMIHMPGGLDDAEFNQNSRQSFRTRNWLTTPWNILALTSEYKVSHSTLLTLKSVVNLSARNIVWKNEDGGPESMDSINPGTLTYNPREVEHETFKSSTTELRSLTNYKIGSNQQVLAAGVRFFYGWMNREEGGTGTTGVDFDLTNYGTYGNNLNFTTLNVAPYVENIFHIGKRLSITPAVRFEYLQSAATGYVTTDADSIINVNESKPRYIPLAGLGLQFKTSSTTNIYANVSQAYRPIEYSFQYPLGLDINAKIDPNLKDISGYNAEAGWRGSIKNFLTFDVGGFYMQFNNDIAIETLTDANANPYTYETNVANAVHEGIETYIEINLFKLFSITPHAGSFSFFNSYAYDNATYVNGLYKGNQAEFAPQNINRLGITYSIGKFSTTYLVSNTSKSFTDASNTVYSPDAEVGIIPAYQVMDWSATFKIKNYQIRAGINNVANTSYFTLRTNEYPGPGIIPSTGRSIYVGFGATF